MIPSTIHLPDFLKVCVIFLICNISVPISIDNSREWIANVPVLFSLKGCIALGQVKMYIIVSEHYLILKNTTRRNSSAMKTENPSNILNIKVSWWRHQMEAFPRCVALLALCVGNYPVTGQFPAQGQWRGALMLSSIRTWINGWVNNREAGDWDASVMCMPDAGVDDRNVWK